jgi:hypothetical protein
MRGLALLVAAGLAIAPGAQAKEFASLVVVGADGRSVELRSDPRVIDQLYPLGPAPWRLAKTNACARCGSLRTISRAGISVLYPAGWYALTVDRHVTNPVLRFQLSTEPGGDGASVPRGGAVVRVEELVPPLLRPRRLTSFPPRPRRFALATFRRMKSWPRGRGTAFRERGRSFYVWVALGPGDRAALRDRVEAILDTLVVRPRRG